MSNYYSLKKILEKNADYNLIIGERSNGKSYAALEHILKEYVNKGKQGAYIRRWADDLKGKRAENVFSALVNNGVVSKLTKRKYSGVIFARGAWHMTYFDEKAKKNKAEVTPFCYAFSLSDMEHDKSASYPKVCNIVFDEFLTRKYYLPDEFVIFMNVLSTIIRDRNDVKIFMLGNTVNKYSPYFSEMGLNNIERMEQGNIDVYTFANKLKIAVEYCSPKGDSKDSDKFFSFDNPSLNMITSGKWEMGIFPHLPQGYKIDKKDIVFMFTIKFNNRLVGCDVVSKGYDFFIYARPRTTQVKDGELCYCLDYTPSPFIRKSFLNPMDGVDKKIKAVFCSDRVFYQSNDIGDLVRNYLLAAQKT